MLREKKPHPNLEGQSARSRLVKGRGEWKEGGVSRGGEGGYGEGKTEGEVGWKGKRKKRRLNKLTRNNKPDVINKLTSMCSCSALR